MELKRLTLKDGEQIRVGADLELSIIITRYGDKLRVDGPFNNNSVTALLSKDGFKITRQGSTIRGAKNG